MRPVTKAFLLAAGLGTRLRPLTDQIPKCLVPIKGRPLCDYWFALCEVHGIREILMNTHHLAEQVEEYVATLNRRLNVSLVHEPELVGSAGTIRDNAAFVDGEDVFLVIYADNLSTADLTRLIKFHESHDGPITVGAFRTDYPRQCGILTADETGCVVEFVEKPANPASNLANAGLYVCDTSIIADIPNDKPVVDFGHDVLPQFIGRMYALPLDCYHLDVGNPESYAKAQLTYPANT